MDGKRKEVRIIGLVWLEAGLLKYSRVAMCWYVRKTEKRWCRQPQLCCTTFSPFLYSRKIRVALCKELIVFYDAFSTAEAVWG
jgi:hypothetical protein